LSFIFYACAYLTTGQWELLERARKMGVFPHIFPYIPAVPRQPLPQASGVLKDEIPNPHLPHPGSGEDQKNKDLRAKLANPCFFFYSPRPFLGAGGGVESSDFKNTLTTGKPCLAKGAIMKNALRCVCMFYQKPFQKEYPLPKTNYQYEKRQKELDKKKKKAEKVRLKEEKKAIKPEENPMPVPEK